MEKSYKKTARDTLVVGIANIMTFVVGLVQLPLLTKYLGAQSYGLWSQAMATIGLILPFTRLGLGGSLVRFLAAEEDREQIQDGFYSLVTITFIVNLIVAIFIIIFAQPLSKQFFDGVTWVVIFTGVLVLLTPLNELYKNLIRTFRQITKHSAIAVAEILIQLGVIVYLVLSGYGIISVILAVLAVRIAILLFLFFHIKSQIGIKKPQFIRLREFLNFGLPLVPQGIAFWLVNLSDRYVIGYFLGAGSVGVYSAAYNMGSLPYSFVAVIGFVLMATLSKLYDEGKFDEVKNHFQYAVKYLLALNIPFICGATILAEPVLKLFTTADMTSGGKTVLPVVAIAVSLLGIHNIIIYALILTKQTKVMAVTWVIAAAINLGLNIVIIPHIGIIGAAITTLVAYTLGLGIIGYFSRKLFKKLGVFFDWRFVLKCVLASAIMSLIVWWMAPQGHLFTILTVVVGVVVYGGVLVLLRGFSRAEFELLKGMLRRKTAGS